MSERSFVIFCRRLANGERLNVFRQVVLAITDEGLTVGDIADQVRLKQPATSQYLAQLERECGLVRSERQGRYVLYRFACDAAFDAAAKVGLAIGKYLRDEAAARHFRKGRTADVPFLRTLEALGNADRAKVAAFVRARGAATKSEVQAALGLTELNARRHLGVLGELGLVESTGEGFRWLEPVDSISNLLLDFSKRHILQ